MKKTFQAQARFDSPLGPLTAAATDDGLAGLWFDGQAHHPGEIEAPVNPAQRWLALAREQLDAYWAGARRFDVPLDLLGTPFQRAVWRALTAIAPGTTTSYARVAAAVGAPSAVRAAGAAIGRNPVSIVVPCHRVVGSDGTLTGYAGGLDRKRALLRLEGALSSGSEDAFGDGPGGPRRGPPSRPLGRRPLGAARRGL